MILRNFPRINWTNFLLLRKSWPSRDYQMILSPLKLLETRSIWLQKEDFWDQVVLHKVPKSLKSLLLVKSSQNILTSKLNQIFHSQIFQWMILIIIYQIVRNIHSPPLSYLYFRIPCLLIVTDFTKQVWATDIFPLMKLPYNAVLRSG